MIDRSWTVAEALNHPRVVAGVVSVEDGGSPDELEVLRTGAAVARKAADAGLRAFALRVSDGLAIVLAAGPEDCGASRYEI